MKSKALFLGLMLAILPSAGWAADVRVVDGDTLEVGGMKYRLHGIDAPESSQACVRKGGGSWACGKAAISAMEDLVAGKHVSCDDRGEDGYGRTIGVCTADGADINAAMIEKGMAWAFVKYSRDYEGLEARARSAGVGVWQAPTEAPWDYRAHKWDSAKSDDAPAGCVIKGNISKAGKIYHMPWYRSYAKTRISLKDGERWFCSEAEALAAGWRAPN